MAKVVIFLRVGDRSAGHHSVIKQPKMMIPAGATGLLDGRRISAEMRSLQSRGGFPEADQLFGKS